MSQLRLQHYSSGLIVLITCLFLTVSSQLEDTDALQAAYPLIIAYYAACRASVSSQLEDTVRKRQVMSTMRPEE